MTPTAYAVLAGCIVLPSIAMALPPCVGADLETPMPKASGVERQTVDVPAARFSGVWQQGQINGFAYRIFPDLTAIVFNERANAGWRIDVLCSKAAPCLETFVGSVPEGARAAAKAIGECLLPIVQRPNVAISTVVAPTLPEPKSTVTPPMKGTTAAPVTKATTKAPAAVPAPPQKNANKTAPSQSDVSDKTSRTGKQGAVSEGSRNQVTKTFQLSSDVATPNSGSKTARICVSPSENDAGSATRAIQRLLTSIGTDPGPIDGVKGKRTFDALEATVGPKVAKLDAVSALIVLTVMICGGSSKTE